MFLSQLSSKFTADGLVRAGFVQRWLVKQNWGVDRSADDAGPEADAEAQRREKLHKLQENFAAYVRRRENRIAEICSRLQEIHRGRRALERAGLIPEGSCRRHRRQHRPRRFSFLPMLHSEDDGDDHLAETVQSPAETRRMVEEVLIPRVLEQTADEQRLRRQRREAMVLNDGTRPLGRGDIIERGHVGSPS